MKNFIVLLGLMLGLSFSTSFANDSCEEIVDLKPGDRMEIYRLNPSGRKIAIISKVNEDMGE